MSARLIYGSSRGADVAAGLRSIGDYRSAAIVESFYGEARRWDERGRTMVAVFIPSLDEFGRRCNDHVLSRSCE